MVFRVLLELKGLPAHGWNIETVEDILLSSCGRLKPTPETTAKVDMGRYRLIAWCINPDLILRKKFIYIPEQEEIHVRGPLLYLNPEEIIHSSCPTLHYQIDIDILEIQDWRRQSDSSDDDSPPDRWDSGSDEEYPGYDDRTSLRPWPKRARFKPSSRDGPSEAAPGSSSALHKSKQTAGFMIGTI